ncbi:MAG TPA: DJ-1/PfpI family protein [Candidatus Paraprevotella stercorigallinarum]|jgi:4-methyl-5(b-hydroxyethyl)-thiazole monophosphate biosynthesis|nr:DJ-1/PfpI family protein [Candidatus Paraprevotella stercorigallinarum]
MKPVYLFFAEGSEEVEALAVVDILRRAGIDIKIVSVADGRLVTGSHGIKVEADEMFDEVDFTDAAMLVLPGGLPGSYNLAEHKGLAKVIQTQYEQGRPLAAICAAPLVYGRMGLLKGKKATCYPGFEENLEGAEYTAALVEEDGQFITGKGPAAVFAFGYAIAARLIGAEKAQAVKNGMLYNELEK